MQPAAEEEEAPVPDLMAALKASLDAVKARDGDGDAAAQQPDKPAAKKKAPAKKSPAKKAPAKKTASKR